MALGPPSDLPTGNEGRLRDRAVFMGDFGRTGKAQEGGASRQTSSGKSRFAEMLDEEIDPETDVAKTSEEPNAKEEQPVQEELKDSQIENRKDADRQSRLGAEGEAEKASAGMARLPHPSMGLAMLMLPHQLQAQTIEKQSQTQAQRDASPSAADEEDTDQVPQPMLEALRLAGLSQPLRGMSDPRLKKTPELGDQWQHHDFPGGRICRWEKGESRQVLRWSDSEMLLESIADGQRQVVQQRGQQVWSELGPVQAEESEFRLPPGMRP